MLYVTSRNKKETYPAPKAVSQTRGPDGGLYMPMHLNPMSWAEVRDIAELPFSEILSQTLNYFFQTKLTRWDMEFGLGRFPVRLAPMNHRIIIGELWHNHEGQFSWLIQELHRRIASEQGAAVLPTPWLDTGVRLAVLWGIFGALIREGLVSEEQKMDVVLVAGDLYGPLAAWYGRQMGLPIANIVCCCNENNSLWELLVNGQFRTDTVSVTTSTPEADIAIPEGLEAFLSLCCGYKEVERYLEICRKGGIYSPGEEAMEKLRQGIQVCVVSDGRMMSTIPNVYSTSGYLLSPYGALSYAGLQDYRARTGESRDALLLCERSAAADEPTVALALKITPEELQQLIRKL